MAWQFRYDGQLYREGDVTIDQWIEIMDLSGTSVWGLVNPLRSPKDAKAALTVVVADRTGTERSAVEKAIGAVSFDEFMAMFEDAEDEDDLPAMFEDGLPQ